MISAVVGENIQRVEQVSNVSAGQVGNKALDSADPKSINAFESHMNSKMKIEPVAEVRNTQQADNHCKVPTENTKLCVERNQDGVAEIKNPKVTDIPCMDGTDTNKDCYGTKILEGLERIRSDSVAEIDGIMLSLQDPNITSADLMAMQYQMNCWSLKQELFAKSAGGFDRSVDTLLKAQ